MENTEKYYLINHLVMITGLTDRTIRSYIASGILQGEKINGLWHFTPEQTESFIAHPAVRPSIQAKQHAAIYDFLLDDAKAGREACVILDFPGEDEKKLAEYFCYNINGGDSPSRTYTDIFTGRPRPPSFFVIILTINSCGMLNILLKSKLWYNHKMHIIF